MLGNLMKNKEGTKKEDAADIRQLREKFKEIKSGNSATPTPVSSPNPSPIQQIEMVDPERVMDNERVTNLIMQQIKELIEIDNNLNARLKELESKISSTGTDMNETKNIVQRFNERLEFIEKNLEKFMGLYEVVTNIFNPFTADTPAKPSLSNPATKNMQDDDGDEPVTTRMKVTGPAAKMGAAPAGPPENVSGAGMPSGKTPAPTATDETENGQGGVGSGVVDLSKIRKSRETKEMTAVPAKQQDTIPSDSTAMHTEPKTESPPQAEATKEAQTKAAEIQVSTASPEVHEDYHFTLHDGTDIKSIGDLASALKKMDDSTFHSYVDGETNDFAEWVGLVKGDTKEAEILAGIADRGMFVQELEKLT